MLNTKSSKNPLRLERCTSTPSQYGHVRAFFREKTFPRLRMVSHATCSLPPRKANEVALVIKEVLPGAILPAGYRHQMAVWQTAASKVAPVRLEPAEGPPREDLQLEIENNAPHGLHVFLPSAEEPSSQEVALERH